MIVHFASFREFLDAGDYSVQLLAGQGNFTVAGTINLYFQAANRSGFNLQSPAVAVNYNIGDAIAVTFNQTAIRSGEEVFYLIIGAENTGNAEDVEIIASISMRELDQTTAKLLPRQLTFSEDTHLRTSHIYQNTSEFPTGDNLIEGMFALVNGDPIPYRYEPSLLEGDIAAIDGDGFWEKTYLSQFTYINSIIDSADKQLFDLNQGEYLATPERQIGNDSVAIRVWIENDNPEDEGISILPGTKYDFNFSISGRENENAKLANTVSYRVIGLVRKLTGEIFTDIEGANFTHVWNPANQILTIEQEILPGYSLSFDLYFNSNSDILLSRGVVLPSDIVVLEDLEEIGEIGLVSDLWKITKDCILEGKDSLRVVPNEVLTGIALIKGYSIETLYPKPIVGLLQDTPDQVLAISASRGGDIFIYQDQSELDPTEAIRAFIGTQGGIAQPSGNSNFLTLANTAGIALTINTPYISNQKALIRSDYPDPKIANLKGQWNSPKYRIYLTQDSSIVYARQQLLDSENNNQLIVQITTLDDYVQVTGIPQQIDPYFCLYGYGEISIAESAGSLPAGSYLINIVWEYPAPNSLITSIDHSESRGVIPDRFDLFDQNLNYWKNTNLTVEQARSLTSDEIAEGFVYGIQISKKYVPFIFDPTITATDNANSIIKPTFLGNSPGAFVPLPAIGQRFIDESGNILQAANYIRVQGDGVNLLENVAANETVLTIPAVPVTDISSDLNLIWHDGSFLQLPDGTLI